MSAKTTNPNQTHETAHKPQVAKPAAVQSVELTQAIDLASLPQTVAAPGLARPADILALQRTVGNRAVTRLIQTKLTVGPAGDQYEQEADRVAQQVMTMPAPAQTQPAVQRAEEDEEEVQLKPLATSITPLLQRQAEEEEEIQTQPIAQRFGEGGLMANAAFEQQLAASRGSGVPLPPDLRAFMEPRFGAEFSGVRVHTNSEAAQLNRAVSAQAFTVGQDVYLGEGRYDPTSATGQRLLAHELTHVVQQTGWIQPRVQRWSIGGWFSKKGHESITEDSIDQWNKEAVRAGQPDKVISDKDKKQLIKGARWNDLLGHWGVATMGMALFGSKESLAHQSHEGELQFLHGMGSTAQETVWKTQHKIMTWAKFCYMVGIGRISADTKLGDVGMTPPDTEFGGGGGVDIPTLFGRWKDKTVSWLFSDSDADKVKLRAVGSMMHMLQDTFCASHTQRVAQKREGEEARKIRSFNVYTEQSASIGGGLFSKWKNRHGMADKLKEKEVTKTAGATEAADIGAVVLKYVIQSASWTDVVEPYLKKIFALEAERPPEQVGNAPEQPKVTASGRLFRKKWLSDMFKSESSAHWYSRRPRDFKMLVQQIQGYEQLLKEDLNTMTQHQTAKQKRAQLSLEKTMVQGIIDTATKLEEKHADSKDKSMQEKRLPAIQELLSELQKDMNEINSDLTSIPNE